jgi:hypothetical protein
LWASKPFEEIHLNLIDWTHWPLFSP